jgi:predicted porin
MRKKLMAVAVAGALAAPAGAQAQIQIYASYHLLYSYLDSGPNSATSDYQKTDFLSQSDSGIGFRMEEKIGGGTSIWGQCESSFDFVSGAEAANGWCARNSAIGMRGGFGNFYMGNWDTPSKLGVYNNVRGWWGSQNPYGISGMITNGAANGGGNTGTAFSRRQARTINYMSPNFGGFNFGAAYTSTNEASSQTSGATTGVKPRLVDVAVNFSTGPLYIGAGYQTHKNFTVGFDGTDTNWMVGAAFTFGGVVKLSGIYSKLEYERAAGANLEATGYGVYVDWTIAGPHSLKFAYSETGDSKGTYGTGIVTTIGFITANGGAGGTKSRLAAVNYAYAFSKRHTGYIGYAKLDNDVNANQNLQSSGPKPLRGGDQSLFGIGLRGSF